MLPHPTAGDRPVTPGEHARPASRRACPRAARGGGPAGADDRGRPGARSKPPVAVTEGTKSAGQENSTPAKVRTWKVTMKWRATPWPWLRIRAWNQLSRPATGLWWVVPPSSSWRIHRSGESQKRPGHVSLPVCPGSSRSQRSGDGEGSGSP